MPGGKATSLSPAFSWAWLLFLFAGLDSFLAHQELQSEGALPGPQFLVFQIVKRSSVRYSVTAIPGASCSTFPLPSPVKTLLRLCVSEYSVLEMKPISLRFFLSQRISLVSSFAASLFLGSYSPIDYSDGKPSASPEGVPVRCACGHVLLRAVWAASTGVGARLLALSSFAMKGGH